MLTKKQAIDVLNNPFSYTKKERQEAVKIGIDILDKIAIANGEIQCVCPDGEWDPVPEHNICIACGKPRRPAKSL